MNQRRLRKQITYAAIYALFWLVIIGVPVLLISRPQATRPDPTPTPGTTPVPISIQRVDVIQHAGVVDVVARLYNPNARVGIVHYPVQFVLFDGAGQEVQRVPVASHILPGSVQYITALNVPVTGPISRVTLETPATPQYATLPENIPLPSFSTYLREQTTRSVGGQSITEQKGVVTNSGSLDWQQVEVVAIAVAADDRPLGIGTTFVGRLTSGEGREFTVQWPMSLEPVARVVTLATTNIFKEDNIIRAVGDPASLR